MTPFTSYIASQLESAAVQARARQIADKAAKFAAAKRMVADGRISFARYLMTANDTGNAVCVHCRGYSGAAARRIALHAIRAKGFRDMIAWRSPRYQAGNTFEDVEAYVIVFRSPYGGLAAIDHAQARKIGLALY